MDQVQNVEELGGYLTNILSMGCLLCVQPAFKIGFD
jgi:hypothetical protein